MTKKLDSLEVLDNLVTEIYNYQNNAIKNTQKLSDAIIGKKVLVRFMKTDAYREGKGKLRFPVMQKIMEEYSDA